MVFLVVSIYSYHPTQQLIITSLSFRRGSLHPNLEVQPSCSLVLFFTSALPVTNAALPQIRL